MLTSKEYHDLKILVLAMVKCNTHGELESCNAACVAVDQVLKEVWEFSENAKRPPRKAEDGIRVLDECGQVKCETAGCTVWHNPEWSDGNPRYGCYDHEEENRR